MKIKQQNQIKEYGEDWISNCCPPGIVLKPKANCQWDVEKGAPDFQQTIGNNLLIMGRMVEQYNLLWESLVSFQKIPGYH